MLRVIKFPITDELIISKQSIKNNFYSILTCVKLKIYQNQWVINNGCFITVLKITFLPCSKQKLFFTHSNIWFLIHSSLYYVRIIFDNAFVTVTLHLKDQWNLIKYKYLIVYFLTIISRFIDCYFSQNEMNFMYTANK